MISVIATVSGNYNLCVTRGTLFVLQGNLTHDELLELRREVDRQLACQHEQKLSALIKEEPWHE